jgi:hypothetical protein
LKVSGGEAGAIVAKGLAAVNPVEEAGEGENIQDFGRGLKILRGYLQGGRWRITGQGKALFRPGSQFLG